jgi:hypothetical protein
MKRVSAIVILMLMLLVGAVSAQDQPPVGVSARQSGNVVYFSVYNNDNTTVCIFPYVQERTNVNGSVVGMIELQAGESNVNIGAFSQSNPQLDWSIQVGSKYREGQCADQ